MASSRDGSVLIPDFTDTKVSDAIASCAELSVNLEITGFGRPGPPGPEQGDRLIEENAEGSAPGDWVDVGGTVGVILFPLEPRQG